MDVNYKIISSSSGNHDNIQNKSIQAPWIVSKTDAEKFVIIELDKFHKTGVISKATALL